MSIVPFPDRFARGSNHEKEVRLQFERRGLTVIDRGLGALPEPARRILSDWPNGQRYEPDFIVCGAETLWFVDAKTSTEGSSGLNYTINKGPLHAHLRMLVCEHIRVAYVFGNMSVATPIDVWNACIGPLGTQRDIRKPYVVFPARFARPMDDVFGKPQWWSEAA